MYSPQDIDQLLSVPEESEKIEFKSARDNFSSGDRSDYCAGIANSGGGKLILGVNSDRQVVGTSVYIGNIQTVPNDIYQTLHLWVKIEEVQHPQGRVVVFDIPKRPHGQRIRSGGEYTYPIRKGESLVEMSDEDTRAIFDELETDFSAKVVKDSSIDDIDQQAMSNLRNLLRIKKSDLQSLDDPALLAALELSTDEGLTLAAIILLANKETISRLIPSAEVIFEWRQDAGKIAHDFRKEWRAPMLGVLDEIWQAINDRNVRIPVQEGLIQRDVLAFNESAIRESLLNALTHRDYSITGRSIMINANPQFLGVTSPGGFLPGITSENVLERQGWRNRRIAEVFQKLGLVERSGQGMNQIFETTIREGKGLPDLSMTDDHQVVISIPAQVKDKNFILFLERVSNQRQTTFSFDEMYELEQIRGKRGLKKLQNKERFQELGIIERIGRTSDARYILSHAYYSYEERPGVYTRLRGLSREHKKQLVLEHLKREGNGVVKDFVDAFPEMKEKDISNLLQELKTEGLIKRVGGRRSGFWETSTSE